MLDLWRRRRYCLTRNAATHQEIVSAGAIQPLVELLLLRPDAVYALYNLMLHTTASPKELGAYALAIAEAGIAALEEIENDESADATMKTFASHTLKAVCRTPLPIEVSSLETWLADSDELLRKINDEPVGKPLAKELKAWLEEKAEEAIVDVISEAGQMPLKTLCNQFKERVGPTKEAQRAFMGKGVGDRHASRGRQGRQDGHVRRAQGRDHRQIRAGPRGGGGQKGSDVVNTLDCPCMKT